MNSVKVDLNGSVTQFTDDTKIGNIANSDLARLIKLELWSQQWQIQFYANYIIM